MSIIHPLPSDVIALIAAGEVIDSLTAVIRELVENAIDAEANRIVISIYPELWKVKIADNGRGMDLEDLRLCVQPHTTSKIVDRDDLWKITSLGFRGEALHSISQLANLEISSRQGENIGWKVHYQEGKVIEEKPIAIAQGTIILVSNLFGNCPVRRKGLPSVSQQLKTIQSLIYQMALCHPEITWLVFNQDKPWFNISGSDSPKAIIPQLIKSVSETDLQEIILSIPSPDKEDHISQLNLVVGLPDRCFRYRLDWVKIAVNGRRVNCPELEQIILSGLSQTLPRDHFPLAFLHLKTTPAEIDWNRHPAKTEIYLHSLSFWQEQVKLAIEALLKLTPESLSKDYHNQRVNMVLKVAENEQGYAVDKAIVPEINSSRSTVSLLPLKAVAQVLNMYIVAEHPQGIWLIEQHIAHERVLYEQIVDRWQLVPLSSPIVLDKLTDYQVDQLIKIGIEIDTFGEKTHIARNAPELLAKREDCQQALLELSLGGDLQTAQVATACRSAIRNGTLLSLEEMQLLIDQWKLTRNPRTCPHGRPIFLALEESSLSRFFRRNWVIGKSHGLLLS